MTLQRLCSAARGDISSAPRHGEPLTRHSVPLHFFFLPNQAGSQRGQPALAAVLFFVLCRPLLIKEETKNFTDSCNILQACRGFLILSLNSAHLGTQWGGEEGWVAVVGWITSFLGEKKSHLDIFSGYLRHGGIIFGNTSTHHSL